MARIMNLSFFEIYVKKIGRIKNNELYKSEIRTI